MKPFYKAAVRIMILLMLVITAVPVAAQESGKTGTESTQEIRLHVFSGFRGNLKNSYSGYNVLFPIAGAGMTWALASAGIDYHVHSYFHAHNRIGNWFIPVYLTGSVGPFALAAYLYHSGKKASDYRTSAAGMAVFQAACISVLSSTVLKFFSGRPFPDRERYDDMKSLSKTFHIGLGKEGIFWGWPSGHTSVTLAAVTALARFYPEKTWVRTAGYTYALYTIIGVSALHNGSMHWFSDAFAATCIGYTIGRTVGDYYRNGIVNSRSDWHFFPFLSQTSAGIRLSYRF